MAKVSGHLWSEVRPGSLDVEMRHPDVDEIPGLRTGDECIEQHRGYRRRAMDVDLIARVDEGDSVLRGHDTHRDDSTTPR